MDDAVRRALEIGPGSTREAKLVDITTYGARTGEPRRIEIVFHRLGGRWYLTGSPRAARLVRQPQEEQLSPRTQSPSARSTTTDHPRGFAPQHRGVVAEASPPRCLRQGPGVPFKRAWET